MVSQPYHHTISVLLPFTLLTFCLWTIRTGSDSDLSQASFRQANTFPYMNTMQHNLGVILGSSPLISMITSMGSKLNTRDSFDNGIAHRNASVESITTTMINNYRQDLAKNAAEIGDAHLQMLRTVSPFDSSILYVWTWSAVYCI